MADPGIVWLASYPRSGNTWVRVLLAHILAPENYELDINALPFGNITSDRDKVDDALGLESADLSRKQLQALWPRVCRFIAQNERAPLFVKTHIRWPENKLQSNDLSSATTGVILIIRHPADVAVSLAHFFSLSIDHAISIMADPMFSYNAPDGGIMEFLPEWSGSWSTHLLSWLDSGVPLHLVKYEDLIADTGKALSGILEFSGLHTTKAKINNAVTKSRLPQLQAAEACEGFNEAPVSSKAFFRKGHTLHGRGLLTPAQVTTLTQQHHDAMVRAGYA